MWFLINQTFLPLPNVWTGYDTAIVTRVKLAVTSPSRHFCNLAKKTPKQKRTDKLKNNSRKTYYGKIISQTTQTNCFKRLVS